MPKTSTKALLVTGVALAAAAASTAHAQDQQDGAEAEADGAGLSQIIVTARKREEDLQSTPISVAAFGADAIAERQASSIADLGKFTPNVSFDSGSAISGSSNSATVFIRGIGQTDFNLTIDPGVGIYVDGVYVSRAVGALLDTADVAQVQILRGPQGTLFGKNTIGGALVLTSQRPADTLGYSFEATTGGYNRVDLKGAINAPLADGLRARISSSLQTRDGYGRRLSDGERTGNRDSLSGRAIIELDATDNLMFTLAGDFTRSREQAPPIKVLAIDEFGFFPFLYNNFTAAAAVCTNFVNGPTAPPNPSPQDPQCYNSQWLTDSPYTNYNGGSNRSDLDVWGVSLTADLETGFGKVKSITAYRSLDSFFALESDGAPMRVVDNSNDYTQEQFSQEVQLLGDGVGGKLDWLLGLFYLQETGRDRNFILPGGTDFISFKSGGAVDNDSVAAFGQLTYEFLPRARITLGARYTWETKRFTPDQEVSFISPPVSGLLGGLPAGTPLLPSVEATAKASEFTPAVTLDYQASDDLFFYGSYSRGFKSGGFTQRVFPPLPVVPSFKPEFVDSWEIGLKSELFDRRLRLNLAAYYLDYTDLQLLVTTFIAPTVQNAGKARSKGFEAEFEAAPTDWLRLNGGLGYIDAGYREVPAVAAPVTVNSELPNTPEWTGNLGAQVTFIENDEFGSISARGDLAYKGGHYKDAVNTPLLRQDGYSLINLALTWRSANERFQLSAGATNVTDKRYLITGYADIGGAGNIYGVYARPREWFLSLKVQD